MVNALYIKTVVILFFLVISMFSNIYMTQVLDPFTVIAFIIGVSMIVDLHYMRNAQTERRLEKNG